MMRGIGIQGYCLRKIKASFLFDCVGLPRYSAYHNDLIGFGSGGVKFVQGYRTTNHLASFNPSITLDSASFHKDLPHPFLKLPETPHHVRECRNQSMLCQRYVVRLYLPTHHESAENFQGCWPTTTTDNTPPRGAAIMVRNGFWENVRELQARENLM